MKKILIAFFLALFVGIVGFFLFHHFVTSQRMDWGGMENPDVELEENED